MLIDPNIGLEYAIPIKKIYLKNEPQDISNLVAFYIEQIESIEYCGQLSIEIK